MEGACDTSGTWFCDCYQDAGIPCAFQVLGQFQPLHTLVSPPALGETQQAELSAAVQKLPASAGTGLAIWNWKVVHRFVPERSGISLSRSSCLNYPRLHEGRLCAGRDLS